MQEIKSRKYQCIKSRRFQNRRVKIKEHSSDAAMFWWDAKERRKGGNGKQKKKKHSRKTKRPRFTNKFIDTLLESSSDKDEGNVI